MTVPTYMGPAAFFVDGNLLFWYLMFFQFIIVDDFYPVAELLWFFLSESAEIVSTLLQNESFLCLFLIELFNFR